MAFERLALPYGFCADHLTADPLPRVRAASWSRAIQRLVRILPARWCSHAFRFAAIDGVDRRTARAVTRVCSGARSKSFDGFETPAFPIQVIAKAGATVSFLSAPSSKRRLATKAPRMLFCFLSFISLAAGTAPAQSGGYPDAGDALRVTATRDEMPKGLVRAVSAVLAEGASSIEFVQNSGAAMGRFGSSMPGGVIRPREFAPPSQCNHSFLTGGLL